MVWQEFKADGKDKRAAFAKADMLAFLDVVDKKLQSSTYVVGNRLTAADIAILCACQPVVDGVLPASPAMPNLRRWLACCSCEPSGESRMHHTQVTTMTTAAALYSHKPHIFFRKRSRQVLCSRRHCRRR